MTGDPVVGPARSVAGSAHDGLYYASDDELVEFAVPFLREAAPNEAVVVIAGGPTRELLTPAVKEMDQVSLLPSTEIFTRTATAILAYQELTENAVAKGARRVRAISEVDFGSTPAGLAENLRFEAVANIALAQQPLWNVCLYDVRRRPPPVVDHTTRAHPYLVSARERQPNPRYLDPADLLRRHSQTTPYALEAGTPLVTVPDLRTTGLAGLRCTIHHAAYASSGLSSSRVDDFVEAVNELATNSCTHGRGKVSVKMWAKGHQLVCTVTDQGVGFDDPLAGFIPIPLDTMPVHGAGLWLARNFSDSLDFIQTPQGFSARVSSWSDRDPLYAPR
jgi:anti-sigma regulatory factor (Ser/Thr protein kinase)